MKKTTHKTSLIDLAPTLCRLVGVEPDKNWKGGNLFEPRKFVFHQTAWNKKEGWNATFTDIKSIEQCWFGCQNERYKYIINFKDGKEELYDLLSDPQEQKNIASGWLIEFWIMRKEINKFLRENPPLEYAKKDNQ